MQEIYEYVKAHEDEFKDVEILIQMRYMDAVLTNRAGSAPNKKNDTKVIKETCLMPFTDMFIFPDGRMGICCCDNFEVTTLADLNVTPIKEAWNSDEYKRVRNLIKDGRIQPGRIEEVVEKAKQEVNESIIKAGEKHVQKVAFTFLFLQK